jgi:glutamyl-tRNA synthetase
MKEVRVRYAPSPTGDPHIGNIRSAIFNWLFAKHNNGKFLVRIEDTDQARLVENGIQKQKDSLKWFGLNWDEIYIQSERLKIYAKYAEQLLEEENAYRCFATQEELNELREKQKKSGKITKYDNRYRDYDTKLAEERSKTEPYVIRFKSPQKGITKCLDSIRGEIVFDNKEMDDFIIIKSDGYPTYHFANVIDDYLMNISHVMRAEEWLPSFPKHVNIYNSLNWQMPIFVHLPMILASDKTKLSKRHGATSVEEFKQAGYLNTAMFNFLVLLGWALDDKTEMFSINELIKVFDINKISKSPAIFNKEKLDWFNGQYILNLTHENFGKEINNYFKQFLNSNKFKAIQSYDINDISVMIKQRCKTLNDAIMLTEFLYQKPNFETKSEIQIMCDTPDQCQSILANSINSLNEIQEFTTENIESTLKALMTTLDVKPRHLLGTLRIVITNQKVSPPIFDCLYILGKKESIKRIQSAIDYL